MCDLYISYLLDILEHTHQLTMNCKTINSSSFKDNALFVIQYTVYNIQSLSNNTFTMGSNRTKTKIVSSIFLRILKLVKGCKVSVEKMIS